MDGFTAKPLTRMSPLPKYLLFVLWACCLAAPAAAQPGGAGDLLDGEYWKQQALRQVLPSWERHGRDSADGQFHAYMDRRWSPYGESLKYPGMLSRHLFSLSAAWLLSGEERYLERADELFAYLAEHGWDESHGGWFYAIDRGGFPADPRKDLFMNIYAATGLALYHLATRDPRAMDLIRRTRTRINRQAWDREQGGYFRRLDRRWRVTDSSKVFTPQVAPVSGYLLYLHGSTGEDSYRRAGRKLMSLAMKKLGDERSGWIRERFRADWGLPDGHTREREEINVGHNIEVSWMLYRLYGLGGEDSLLKEAERLNRKLERTAQDSSGAWLHKMLIDDPGSHPGDTPWWVQAYGNMQQLYRYRLTGDERALRRFRRGASFWNRAFLDGEYGGTVLSATLDGRVSRGDKAVRTKTSYHAVEHAMLNYLYLTLWVEEETVELYFKNRLKDIGKPLCFNIVEDPNLHITELDSPRGSLQLRTAGPPGCLRLEGGKDTTYTIRLRSR